MHVVLYIKFELSSRHVLALHIYFFLTTKPDHQPGAISAPNELRTAKNVLWMTRNEVVRLLTRLANRLGRPI